MDRYRHDSGGNCSELAASAVQPVPSIDVHAMAAVAIVLTMGRLMRLQSSWNLIQQQSIFPVAVGLCDC